MSTLEDTVQSVVQDFIDNGGLFTALDVSNMVKSSVLTARHREVRDIVRSLFVSVIEAQGYVRTPITVTLDDGITTAEALLYHPLSDTWDIDNKYSQQKRSQTASNPLKTAIAAKVAQVRAAKALVATTDPTATVSVPATTASVTVSATTAIPMPTARNLWDQLFASQPSLFPTK